MPFFKMPYTSSTLWRFYYIFPSGVVPCLYLSFLKHDITENSAQNLQGRKASRIILSLWKVSSAALLEMWELVPFREAKCRVLPLWCWLLALQTPRGPGAQSGACLWVQLLWVCRTSHVGCHAQRPIAQHKAGEQTLNQQQLKILKPLIHNPTPISLPLQPF